MTPGLTTAVQAIVTRPDRATWNALDRLRCRGVQAWALIGWTSLAALLAADILIGAGVGFPMLIVGVLINLGPTLMAVRGRHDAQARTLMGTIAAVVPAMLVFLLKGHPWQMDAHMYFFVGMAALVMLADWRPIVLATVLTAVHHVLLERLAPGWVFTGPATSGASSSMRWPSSFNARSLPY